MKKQELKACFSMDVFICEIVCLAVLVALLYAIDRLSFAPPTGLTPTGRL